MEERVDCSPHAVIILRQLLSTQAHAQIPTRVMTYVLDSSSWFHGRKNVEDRVEYNHPQ